MMKNLTPKIILITFLLSTIITACTSLPEPLPTATVPSQDTLVPATPSPVIPTNEVPDKNDLKTPILPGGKAPIDMTPISPDEMPSSLQPVVQQAISELAESLSIDADQILVLSAKSVTWSDSSLGCPQPGMNYMQVLTEGYQVILVAKDAQYNYNANKNGYGTFCENPSPPYSDGTIDS